MNHPPLLKAGTAQTTITPPDGAPLVTRPSTGVHDDLYARAPVRIGSNRRLDFDHPDQQPPTNPDDLIIPWVDVLRLDARAIPCFALLFSTAAHPVIVHHAGDLISADYPGCAITELQQQLGPDVFPLFAQGCCGDINGDPLNSGFQPAAAAGATLAHAVLTAAQTATAVPSPRLTTASTTFAIPLADAPTPDQCRQRSAEIQARATGPQAATITPEEAWWIRDALLCLDDLLDQHQRGETPSLRFDAHALALTDRFCLLALPHEVFSAYQRHFDQTSPFAHTMTLAFTNACEAYLPTDRALETGGPETAPFGAPLWYHHRRAPRQGTEQLVQQKVATLLSDLHTACSPNP